MVVWVLQNTLDMSNNRSNPSSGKKTVRKSESGGMHTLLHFSFLIGRSLGINGYASIALFFLENSPNDDKFTITAYKLKKFVCMGSFGGISLTALHFSDKYCLTNGLLPFYFPFVDL